MLKVLRPYEYHSDLRLKLKHATLATITKAMLNRLYGYRLRESQGKKLLASNMLDILSNFFGPKIPYPTGSLFIMSGHDSNIINVLANILDREFLENKIQSALTNKADKNFLIPPLASSLIFELVQVGKDPKLWVRVVYNGEAIKDGFARAIRRKEKHEEFLDFEDFNKLLKERVDTDYKLMNCSKTIG
jgi:hypothetical protein